MEQRSLYRHAPGDTRLRVTDSTDKYYIGVASPILSEGDIMGCVMILTDDDTKPFGETEQKLVQTVSGFLGRQMES